MNYDIFRDELGSKYPAYGHALWEPGSGGLYNSVEVGDVGFIRRGRFHRLFNALLARGHELQSSRVPEYHEPLKPNEPSHICTSTLSPNAFRSTEVTVDPGGRGINASDPEPERVTYLCSRKKGAILSLPVPAQCEDTVAFGDFGKWLIKHIDVWFAFARNLGFGINRMEDIILVTGRHLARSSANVAFSESQLGEQVSFGVSTDTSGVNVTWQFSGEDIRGVSFNPGPSGQDLPENQCIFVRGFHVTRFLNIVPRLRAEADPDQDSGGHGPEFDTQLVSIPADTNYQDPLHTLLHYLSVQSPECDMALVHDDDLKRSLFQSLEGLQPDVVLSSLQESRPKIFQVQCDWLPSSSSETQRARVATLSKYIFEDSADYLAPIMESLRLSNAPSTRLSSDPGSLLNPPLSLATQLYTSHFSKKPGFNPRLQRPDHILRCAATIEMLSDNVLVDIFEFCLMLHERIPGERAKMWNRLVHVCERWRIVVFSSAMHLDLRLFCTDSTPVRETLDVWPPFPIEIRSYNVEFGDNIIDALMHPDRIYEISIYGKRIPPERLESAMRKPFPALELLSLCPDADGMNAPAQLPNTFLGGSAPRLREITLRHISFPTLPQLLLSSSNLSELHLHDIPPTGYIPPEAMVACASALTKLKSLTIGFKSLHDHTISTPRPSTRAVFSSLTHFQFRGACEYLDDLLARFYAPDIEVVNITLFNEFSFHLCQLDRFTAFTRMQTSCNRAEIVFTGGEVEIKLLNASLARFRFSLRILCTREVQVSSMAQICHDFRSLRFSVKSLDFQDKGFHEKSTWLNVKESAAWQDIFRNFKAVHTLFISGGLHTPILSVLQRLDEESAGVLPRLQDLYLVGYEPSGSNIEPFITKRQDSKRPVIVHSWDGMTPPGNFTPRGPATNSLRHPRAAVPARRIKDKKSAKKK